MAQFFGDPKIECRECNCDIRGSRSLQCDMRSGACLCLPGIGGYNCDVCDRGYIGQSPHCSACGECFDNWDRILKNTKSINKTLISLENQYNRYFFLDQTLDIINKARNIKTVGATGAYTKEFDDMQSQLDEIQQLLNNTHNINIDAIDKELQSLRLEINQTEQGKLKELDSSLANTRENMYLTELKLNSLKDRLVDLKNKTRDLENNGTQLQEANVQGALTLIQNAKDKADRAAGKAEHTGVSIYRRILKLINKIE